METLDAKFDSDVNSWLWLFLKPKEIEFTFVYKFQIYIHKSLSSLKGLHQNAWEFQ